MHYEIFVYKSIELWNMMGIKPTLSMLYSIWIEHMLWMNYGMIWNTMDISIYIPHKPINSPSYPSCKTNFVTGEALCDHVHPRARYAP